MKKFAFFLPQFHTIPENDEWWGAGFTEWTNVKKAKPLYRGHVQPIRPQNNNYYCLLDKKVVEWQTNLMKQYCIDGLVYYHYYFNGKLLLEKPAENLLEWKDIEQPFFFCWANHSWIRSWQGTKEVLLPQEYGTISDWEKHFEYLLPFFKDKRYEKIDNMPLFMFFSSVFSEKNDYIEFLDLKCKEAGFKGLYVIESFDGGNIGEYERFKMETSVITKKIFFHEPAVTLDRYWHSKLGIIKRLFRGGIRRILPQCAVLNRIDGNIFYRLQMTEKIDDAIWHEIVLGFDNTARHGKRGTVIEPPSKEELWTLLELYKDSDYVFINAWNEWAEKMVLEPTEEWGDRYLRWIKEWSDINI